MTPIDIPILPYDIFISSLYKTTTKMKVAISPIPPLINLFNYLFPFLRQFASLAVLIDIVLGYMLETTIVASVSICIPCG